MDDSLPKEDVSTMVVDGVNMETSQEPPHQPSQQQTEPPKQIETSEMPEQTEQIEQPEQIDQPKQPELLPEQIDSQQQQQQQQQQQSEQQQQPSPSTEQPQSQSDKTEAPQQLFGFTTNARASAPSLTKANILEAIKDFDSSIPDAVVHHFLNVAGMQTSDQRIIRLIAIAAQKFIHEIVSDSLQHCKLRGAQGKKTKEKKYTLTIEDLAAALAEYGIEVRRQHYFN